MARDKNGDPLSIFRRFLLLLIASGFVAGCGVLTLGMRVVPVTEIVAVTAALFYVLAASLLQPAPWHAKARPQRIKPLALDKQLTRGTVRLWLLGSLLLSLVLPWAWILWGVNARESMLLGPHLFLMMAQVLFEIWSYRTTVSIVIRIGIPVAFVSYRLTVLVAWVREAFAEGDGAARDLLMKGLAVSNLLFWGIVLFYVLLLKVCPPYFLERNRLRKSDTSVVSQATRR